jgi:DNA-directed RNA polymerase specialized sigma24 family protein
MKQQWTLSQSAFDQFLAALHSDRQQAGHEYRSLRDRIVRFFEWRSCSDPDALADESLDRVIRKISQGEQIEDAAKYTFGVAKLVYLESTKKQHREEPIVIDFPVKDTPVDDDDDSLTCLERCLGQTTTDSRKLILRYYSFDKQAKIDDRRKLADELGLSPNALRIKALRVRSKIEGCVTDCLAGCSK